MGNQFVSFRLPPSDIEVLRQVAIGDETVSSVVKRLTLEFIAVQRSTPYAAITPVITNDSKSAITPVITNNDSGGIANNVDIANNVMPCLRCLELERKIADWDKFTSELTERRDACEDALEHLKLRQADLEWQAEDARLLGENKDKECKNLIETIESQPTEIDHLREGLLAYDAECDRLTGDNLYLREAVVTLGNGITTALESRDRLLAELECSQDQKQKLSTEVEELHKGLDAYNSETERLTVEKLRIRKIAVGRKQEIKDLTSKLDGATASQKALENQLAVANADNESLRDRVAELEAMPDGGGLSLRALLEMRERYVATLKSKSTVSNYSAALNGFLSFLEKQLPLA